MTPATVIAAGPRWLPWRTAALVVGGGLIYVLPGSTEYLIYDRSAILSGEIWRLVTGHGVHYSSSHLAYNLVALATVGAIIELQESRRLFLICTVSALMIGISLLGFRPDLDYFAGASGVVTAAVAYCALSGLSAPGPWRAVCLTVLVLLVGKIALELLWSGSSLVGVSGDFVIVPLSHAVGAASGLLMFSWWRWRDTKDRDRLSQRLPYE
jgi:rhomboid family GlyGly-CTERM serine protease